VQGPVKFELAYYAPTAAALYAAGLVKDPNPTSFLVLETENENAEIISEREEQEVLTDGDWQPR
jgi:hypothetical protein